MTDEELMLLLNKNKKQINLHRAAGDLPPKDTEIEDILKYVFENNTRKSSKERKTEQEIIKLKLQTDKLAGSLVEKREVDEYIKTFFQKINSATRNLSIQLLNDIVADPKHKETNKNIINKQCKRFLEKLQEDDNENI